MKGFQTFTCWTLDSAPSLLTAEVGDDSVSILDLIMNRGSIDNLIAARLGFSPGILLGRADD